jgi:hypothetical protein
VIVNEFRVMKGRKRGSFAGDPESSNPSSGESSTNPSRHPPAQRAARHSVQLVLASSHHLMRFFRPIVFV